MPSPVVAYNTFKKHLMEGKFNFKSPANGGHTIKVMLSNDTTNVTDVTKETKGQITEIADGNGYPAGGFALTVNASSGLSGSVYKYIVDDLTITANGGSIGPFRYVVFYNDSVSLDPNNPNTSKPLIGYADYGSQITLGDGESFVLDFSQVDGFIQLV